MFLSSVVALISIGARSVSSTQVVNSGAKDIRNSGNEAECKCVPSNPCWPAGATWNALNTSISGKLIQNTPPAIVCYPGPQQNASACTTLATSLTDGDFVINEPVALDYPISDSCPIPQPSTPLGTCSSASIPSYTVNATEVHHVSKAIDFARTHNIRLVIRNTGHDNLGRSAGPAGSLEIWIHHLRNGLTFHPTYIPEDKCTSSWTGSVFTFSGGYTWGDVYPEAKNHNVVVVSGSESTVGVLGGWAQGGGHSALSRNFGLGADQILSASVALADGSIVTASPCQHTDLFFAIRGGGGGTYGVVLETTVKAYPMVNVTSQILSFAPKSDEHIPEFLEALRDLYSTYPDLNDAGFSGYGSWAVQSFAPVNPSISNSTTGYIHALNMFNSSLPYAKSTTELFLTPKLQAYKNLIINETFITYQSYWQGIIPGHTPVGIGGALGSHFLDREALTSSPPALLEMLNITAGLPGEFAQSNVCLVSGGQAHVPTDSGLNPDWRKAYVHNIVARGWALGTNASIVADIENDITYKKVGAMRKVAPKLGCYMNEADRNDPFYREDFYGSHFYKLRKIKGIYDPESVFYCPTCVGSEDWEEKEDGRLCLKR